MSTIYELKYDFSSFLEDRNLITKYQSDNFYDILLEIDRCYSPLMRDKLSLWINGKEINLKYYFGVN